MIKLKTIFFYFYFIALGSFSNFSYSTIYLDHEIEPWPLCTVTIVLPYGTLKNTQSNSMVASLLSDILSSGPETLSKQEFRDQLASFGASFNVSVGEYRSEISLSFPYNKKRNYQQLIDLIKQTFQSPRLNRQEVEFLKKLKLASFIRVPDYDSSLIMTFNRYWFKSRKLQLATASVEEIQSIQYSMVENMLSELMKGQDLWVGFLGSSEALPIVKKLGLELFPDKGNIVTGKHLGVLFPMEKKKVAFKATKEVIILDKKDLNQSLMSFYLINPDTELTEKDLARSFHKYLLVDAGLDSILSNEFRKKRGLSYFVKSMGAESYGYPVTGFLTNPQKVKEKEAVILMKQMIEQFFATPDFFSSMDEDTWSDKLKAFKYRNILSNGSASQRLSRRKLVVTDQLAKYLYLSNPDDWEIHKSDVVNYSQKIWNNSSALITVLGDSVTLKPLLEKIFPDYELKIIPYTEVIHAKIYQ